MLPKLPDAPVREVIDDYFGTKVSDPYRWLENSGDPEVIAWMKAQNKYARAVLANIPGRDRLLDRIKALDRAGSVVSALKVLGEHYFYMKADPGSDIYKLYVRDRLTGAERLLVDPENMSTDPSTHFFVDYFQPSLDGKYVAYGISRGGSQDSILRIVETATGKVLSDAIDRARLARLSWLPDGSFFYTRTPKLPPDTPPSAKYQKGRTYRHVLGGDPDKETAVFGYQVSPDVKVTETDVPALYYSAAAPNYLVGLIMHGAKREFDAYTTMFLKNDSTKLVWKKAVDAVDEVTGYDTHGDSLFLLSHKDASRFKVLRTSLANPDLAHAGLVVPVSERVVTGIFAARDALYVQELDGGIGRMHRLSYENASLHPVKLPFDGAIRSVTTNPIQPEAWLELTSWTKSPLWYELDALSGQLTDTGLVQQSPVDSGYSQIESAEVNVKSADGTMVPLSIVHQQGMPLDGSHPTWLQAFGVYGAPLEPIFRPTLLAFFERGGVFAVAHVRGGGEYGEEWHLGGCMQTKQHSADDMLAAATHLIEHRYTSPLRLAGECTSAAGVTVGTVINQRPELFAVALILVGQSNPLRSETMPAGPANTSEFGTVTDSRLFPALYAMDPYQHVEPNTPYPAVLLTAGGNDRRMEAWQAAKMTARLQASSNSGKPVLLRIEYDMGHSSSLWAGFGSTKTQRNEELADELAFMFWQMGVPEFQPGKQEGQFAAR
ncbi:MAG: prolyl oligopeptidase family serine peptidase [Candidatus Sulfotelmatobacter sp.]|jgi:prolyl oligopeptidase